MVFVKISLMDFSVIAKLDSSGLIVNQVWFVLQMGQFNVVTDRFSPSAFSTEKNSMLHQSCVSIIAFLVHLASR